MTIRRRLTREDGSVAITGLLLAGAIAAILVWGLPLGIDFTGGVGGESLLFYTQYGNCSFSACAASVNSNHFLVHAGAEVRYMLWHRLFIRPEANLYHVFDNSEFHSDNVLRLGASVGITFHRD